jgi:DNA polymerase-3 subunit epsilon
MKTNEEIIKDRDKAINEARNIITQDYFVVDTETTGLTNAQMCQIAVLQSNGDQFKSLVKPTIPIELGAMNVHHITDEMVKDAPNAIEVMKGILIVGIMVIYNAPFDIKVINQSLIACGSPVTQKVIDTINLKVVDAMQIYSKFRGEWNDYYNNYRWHKLEVACSQCGIVIDLELHDALSDCIMTDRLIHYIAEQKLSTELQ